MRTEQQKKRRKELYNQNVGLENKKWNSWYSEHKNNVAISRKKHYESRVEKEREKKYGLKKGEYGVLFDSQMGLCAICGRPQNDSRKKNLCVDHNHSTNKVRGLLCINCNVAIGMVRESIDTLEKMISYLKKHSMTF